MALLREGRKTKNSLRSYTKQGLSLMKLDEMGFPQNSGKPCCI